MDTNKKYVSYNEIHRCGFNVHKIFIYYWSLKCTDVWYGWLYVPWMCTEGAHTSTSLSPSPVRAQWYRILFFKKPRGLSSWEHRSVSARSSHSFLSFGQWSTYAKFCVCKWNIDNMVKQWDPMYSFQQKYINLAYTLERNKTMKDKEDWQTEKDNIVLYYRKNTYKSHCFFLFSDTHLL